MKRIIKAAVAVAVCGLAAAVTVPAQAAPSFRADGGSIVGKAMELRHTQVTNLVREAAKGRVATAAGRGVLLNGQEVPTGSNEDNTALKEFDEKLNKFVKALLKGSPSDMIDAWAPEDTAVENPASETLNWGFEESTTTPTTPTNETNSAETAEDRSFDLELGRLGLREQQAATTLADAVPGADRLEMAPVVREVTPVEAAPATGAVSGLVSGASLDEIAPLVDAATDLIDDNVDRAIGATGDTQGAVAESVAQTTDPAAQN
ncbi:hypothetical protein ACFXJ8_19590 [Nonomuraea sp. NPDC059194]|uniref:hypothetical protein n=1 Tax=Nonomuraea sp. NPDC059194 TaxID=3346764 RepID=UPI0036A93791